MKTSFKKSTNKAIRKTKAIRKAVKLVNGPKGMADIINLSSKKKVSRQVVEHWMENGTPPKWVLKVEGAVDAQVTRHELDPELYPREKQ